MMSDRQQLIELVRESIREVRAAMDEVPLPHRTLNPCTVDHKALAGLRRAVQAHNTCTEDLLAALRRADELIIEYHELLFDRWQVEPQNIILAAERNPFENCRQLTLASQRYLTALMPLGGCRLALSAFSSKMMSLGVLMSAYELRFLRGQTTVYLVNIEAQGYALPPNLPPGLVGTSEMHLLWLRGECYV